MKVAGRKNMVTAAIVIIDALSFDVCCANIAVKSLSSLLCSANSWPCKAICWFARLSSILIRCIICELSVSLSFDVWKYNSEYQSQLGISSSVRVVDLDKKECLIGFAVVPTWNRAKSLNTGFFSRSDLFK